MSLDSFEPLDDDFNPYAAPKAKAGPVPEAPGGDLAEAEAIRRAYINHEAGFKSIGSLYIIGGVLWTIAVVGLIVFLAGDAARQGAAGIVLMLGVTIFYVVLAALNYAIGIGLTRLQVWARWTALVFAVLGLIGVAINSVVAGLREPVVGLVFFAIFGGIFSYILYLLASSKATFLCTPEYRAIVKQTPHVKYRTPWWVWVIALLIVGGLVIGLIAAGMKSTHM